MKSTYRFAVWLSLVTTALSIGAISHSHAAPVTWTGATNGAWDTTTGNWTGGTGSLYTTGDSPTFGDTGANKNITVAAGGITAGAVLFSNTVGVANNYTVGGGPINGSGGLTVNGGGTVTLTGANGYTGTTLVTNNSLLIISNANALGQTGAGNGTTVHNGSALNLQGGFTLNEALTLNGEGANFVGSLRSISGNNTVAGLITLGSQSRIRAESGTTLRITGGITTNNFDTKFAGSGEKRIETTTFAANNVYSYDGGLLVLNVAGNTITNLRPSWGGRVQLGVANALNSNVNLIIGDNSGGDTAGGRFDLNGFNQTIASLSEFTFSSPNSRIVSNENSVTASTLTINNAATNTFSGRIGGGAGKLNLVKSNTGALNLNGPAALGSVVLASGSIGGTGSMTVTDGIEVRSGTFNIIAGGTGGLTKNTAGTVTIAKPLSYTGNTVINEGVLKLQSYTGLNVGGASLWFDGTDVDGNSATPNGANGTAVGAWVNKGSLTGVNVAQSNAARQPVISTGAMNGLDVIHFERGVTGTEDFLEINNAMLGPILNNSHTLFVVARTSTGGADAATNASQGIVVSEGNHNGITFGGNPNATSVSGTQWLNSNATNISSSSSYTLGTPVVLDAVVSGSNTTAGTSTIQLFVDGVGQSVSSLAGSTLMNSNANRLRIGSARGTNTGSFDWFLTGDVAEVLLFPTALSAADRQAVEQYLLAKWKTGTLQPHNILPSSTALTLTSLGTLDLNGVNQTIASIGDVVAGQGGTITNTASATSATLTLGGTSGATTFSGNIVDGASPISLAKTGGSTQVLAGANTYSGTTSISGGELIVNGTHTGAGAYNVSSGARLGGDGSITIASGLMTIAASPTTPGHVSPGDAGYLPSVAEPLGSSVESFSYSAGLAPNTIGTLSVDGDVDFGGKLLIDIGDAAANSQTADLFDVAGVVTLGSNSQIEINGVTDLTQLDLTELGYVSGDIIPLVTADSIVGEFSNFASNQWLQTAGGEVFFGNDGASLFLQLQAIPEPTTIALWALVGLGLVSSSMRRPRRTRN